MFEVGSFTIDSMIKEYRVYKDVWSSFKCFTIAVMKEVKKGFLGRYPAAEPTELYGVFEVLVKRHRLANHKAQNHEMYIYRAITELN